MTSNGPEREPIPQIEALELIERAGESGWGAKVVYDTVDRSIEVEFSTEPGTFTFGPDETVRRLGLLDEEGRTLPGYTVDTKKDSGNLFIGYSGRVDVKFREVVRELYVHGFELGEIHGRIAELKRIAERIGPEAVGMALARLEDAEVFADPELQNSIAAWQRGEVVDIPTSGQEG